MIVELVTELARLEALREEWDAVADRFASPMLRHAWFAAAAATYGEELSVFTIRRGGRLAAAAPLVVDRSGVVPRLRILAHQDKEPDGFLYEDEAALAALCDAVLAARRPLVLMRLPVGSPEWRLLAERARPQGLSVLRPGASRCWFAVLPRGAEAFEDALGSKKRGRLRRSRTALEAEGRVEFEMLSPSEAEVDAVVTELERVETASWKLAAGTALVCKPAAAAFLREHARRAAAEGMLRFSRLRLDEVTVACQLDVEHGGRLWCQKVAFDERWAKHSPGILNMHEVLKRAADRGLEGLEHLGFAEEWQRRWPHEAREYGVVRFYPRRAAGALAFGADSAAFAARNVRARAAARARPQQDRAA